MIPIERVEDYLVGRIAFPTLNHLYNRPNIWKNYQALVASQYYSREQLTALRLKRLQQVIRDAYDYSPFYQKRFNNAGVKPDSIKSLSDIERIPPLTREDLVTHCNDLVDQRQAESIAVSEQQAMATPVMFAPYRKHKLIKYASSGSTGIPVVFYDDGSNLGAGWINEMRLLEWYGLYPGVRQGRIHRVTAEFMPSNKSLLMRKLLWHQLVLPGLNLSDAEYTFILEQLERFRPKVLWGITSALTGLAEYIQRTGWNVNKIPLGLVMTWAAPCHENEKRLLEDVFKTPVTNIYGSRELGHVAMICPHGSLHINEENYLVESEPSSITGSKDDPGELLVTTLFQRPMPFIRYRIGDVGRVVERQCECGRSLYVLDDLIGRLGDIYVTENGQMIAPNFWPVFFAGGVWNKVVEIFQVILHSNKYFTIRIVKRDNYTPEIEAAITKGLRENFAPTMKFDFEYVSKIDPLPSGKYQIIINEMDAT